MASPGTVVQRTAVSKEAEQPWAAACHGPRLQPPTPQSPFPPPPPPPPPPPLPLISRQCSYLWQNFILVQVYIHSPTPSLSPAPSPLSPPTPLQFQRVRECSADQPAQSEHFLLPSNKHQHMPWGQTTVDLTHLLICSPEVVPRGPFIEVNCDRKLPGLHLGRLHHRYGNITTTTPHKSLTEIMGGAEGKRRGLLVKSSTLRVADIIISFRGRSD